MLKEFKEFAMKGNVVDMAVGVVIGGAFGKIVTSLVSDIIMPLIGLLIGGLDFTNLFISLDGSSYPTLQAAEAAGAATLNYGVFLGTVLDFLIISFSIFMVIRQINRVSAMVKEDDEIEEEATEKECPYCLSEIPIKASKCSYCTSSLD